MNGRSDKLIGTWYGRIGVVLAAGVCALTTSVPTGFAKKESPRHQDNTFVIPAGTPVHIHIIDELNTGTNSKGDSFRASLAQPVVAGGRTVAAKDALVMGKVTEVVSSGRLRRPASITLQLTQVKLANGRLTSVETSPYKLDGKSHTLRNAALIGGGAAAGAVLGGVAAGKKGAIIGGSVGAGAGTATAYLTGKEEIVVPPETSLEFIASGTSSRAGTERSVDQWSNTAFAGDKHNSRDDNWVFSERDRQTIRDYFRSRYGNLPPGLAKRSGNLPPGLEKQLHRNGKLPPGLQKRVEPFPRELEIRLRRLPEFIRRVILGRRALMLDDANHILDELMID